MYIQYALCLLVILLSVVKYYNMKTTFNELGEMKYYGQNQ